MRLLEDLESLGLSLGKHDIESAAKAVVYIKPSDPLMEMRETSMLCRKYSISCDCLFGLEWQDVVEAADRCLSQAAGVSRLVLTDVEAFLKRRGLEYFKGFRLLPLAEIASSDGAFYDASEAFAGFATVNLENLDRSSGAFYRTTGEA